MERVQITRLNLKDGQGAKGPWKKVGIQTDKHGNDWLGCFYTKFNESALSKLAVGQTIDIVVTKSPDGKYLNFSLPSRLDLLEQRVTALESRNGADDITDRGYVPAPPQDDINPEDIPF